MDARNAVHIRGNINCKARHVDGVIRNDLHARAARFIDACCAQLRVELVVDAADNFAQLRHNAVEKLKLPFFKGFAHNRVVGVGERIAGDLKRRIKIQALQHQQADQLRDGNGRMRVIELHCTMRGKARKIAGAVYAAHLLIAADDILHGCT